jgi:hypothetical protein
MPTVLMPLLQSERTFDPVTGWILIGFGALATVYLLLIRPKMRRRDPLQDSGPRLSLAQQRSVETQMQNLLVELSEMARQVSAQLDTRAQKLELLIQEADQKIAQLRELQSAAPPARPAVGIADAPQPADAENAGETAPAAAAPAPFQPELDPRHAEVYALADQGQSAYDIANQLGRPRGEIELILALRPRG